MTGAPLRIVFVGTLPPHPGGSAIANAGLLRGLAGRGHALRAVAPLAAGAPADGMGLRGVELVRYPVASFHISPDVPLRAGERAAEAEHVSEAVDALLAEAPADILLAGRETHAPLVGRVAASRGLPWVAIAHGGTLAGLRGGSWDHDGARALLDSLASADRVVSASHHLAEALRRLGVTRAVTIPNGVDLEKFTPGPPPPDLAEQLGLGPDAFVVLHPSNLKPLKRALDLVEAAALAGAQRPELVIVVAGDGPDRARLERTVRERDLESRFRFTGWVDHERMPGLIRLAGAVVLPSETENQALAYLETQACGRVLVASDVPGAREVIEDGVTGLLFRRGDTAALAASLVRVASDPALRARIGAASREAVAARSIERTVAAHEAVLRDATDQAERRRAREENGGRRTGPDAARVRGSRPAADTGSPFGAEPPRIATVYKTEGDPTLALTKMSLLRWVRISEALARLGYEVDMLANVPEPRALAHPRARVRPLDGVDWASYDVVKTLFHNGFEVLQAAGGADHPLILSKLGSVVGSRDDVPGVHFKDEERAELFELQRGIARSSRFVTILTEESRRLWEAEHGNGRRGPRVLLVPTGVDRDLPPPRRNPYEGWGAPVAVYIGNLYDTTQVHVNRLWQDRLNALGAELRRRGMRLCFVGPGVVDRLDPELVTAAGPVPVDDMWDWQRFAAVGIVLAQGPVQHNESSKIYYYLRTGLPVVSESSVPNNHVFEAAGLGIAAPYGDDRLLAEAVVEAARRPWPREEAIRHVLAHHTWDSRAAVYDRVIRRELGLPEAG